MTSPPSGLKPKPGVSYFSLERTDPCWTSMGQTKSIGIYVPDSIEHFEAVRDRFACPVPHTSPFRPGSAGAAVS